MRCYHAVLLLICLDGFAKCHEADRTLLTQTVQGLDQRIRTWDQAYHADGQALVTDALYDQTLMLRQTLGACLEQPDLHQPLANLTGERTHPVAHTGLTKLKDDNAVRSWLRTRDQVWVQPKIDGIAVSLRYESGQLVEILSRGDGLKGFDLTRHAPFIAHLPMQLSKPLSTSFQAELYALATNHIQAKQGAAGYRDKVAGLMQRSQAVPADEVGVFAWEWPDGPHKIEERLDALTALGFTQTQRFTHKVVSVQDVRIWRERWFNSPLPFSTDGIVLKQSLRPASTRWQNSPSAWAAAWKYPSLQTAAIVKNIEFRIGRTGRITPVVELYPALIDGKRIRFVSLGSLARWQRADIRPQDVIAIHLAGGVIPHYLQTLTQATPRPPLTTPETGYYHATTCFAHSTECHEQLLARLVWLSKQLGFKGLGKGYWQQWLLQHPDAHLLDWLDTDPHLKAQALEQGFAQWSKALGLPASATNWHELNALSQRNTSQAKRLRHWLEQAQVQALNCKLAQHSAQGFSLC